MRQPTLLDFMEYMEYTLKQEEIEKANTELQELVTAAKTETSEELNNTTEDDTYDFSDILDILKNDDDNIRVKRTTWGNASVYLVTPTDEVTLDDGKEYIPQPYFTLVSGSQLISWQPDTEDILADNWVIA